MIYWSIYKTAHLSHELAARFPHAVSHDGTNTVFVDAPTDQSNAFIVPAYLELPELTFVVGKFLASQVDTPLIATREQLVTLFNTPHHRLWCAKYEDVDSLQADYEAVFSSQLAVDSLENMNAAARTAIFNVVTA